MENDPNVWAVKIQKMGGEKWAENLITTTDGILICRDSEKDKKANPSILLINDLAEHFLIPKHDEHKNVTDALAFYSVCYLALMKELKGTEVFEVD